jgi:hypothetical protein
LIIWAGTRSMVGFGVKSSSLGGQISAGYEGGGFFLDFLA